MIQGGDPDSKHAQPGQRLGQGGPGYTIDAEINPKHFHEKGSLSAAQAWRCHEPQEGFKRQPVLYRSGRQGRRSRDAHTIPDKFNKVTQTVFR